MFKVAVINYVGEEVKYTILPGDFSDVFKLVEAYPMLSWVGLDNLQNFLKDVLCDTVWYDECTSSIYAKEHEGDGTNTIFVDDPEFPYPQELKPNEEQLKMLREYDIVFIIFDK